MKKLKHDPVKQECAEIEIQLRRRIKELEEREEQLQKNKALYAKILDALPLHIFLENKEGQTLYVNEMACRNNQVERHEIIGNTIFDLFPEEVANRIRKSDLEVWHTKKYLVEEKQVGTDDQPVYKLAGKKIFNADSPEEYLLGFVFDITDRVKAEQQLRESEEKFRMVLEQAADSYFLINNEGAIVDVNTTACKMLGYSREELLSLTVEDITSIPMDQVERYYQLCNENRSMNVEHYLICKSQMAIPVDTNVALVMIGNKNMYAAMCRDIRDKKKAEERIRFMAFHDSLTGLPNRWYLRSYIETYVADARNKGSLFALLLLDLDYFKTINDTLGHQAGDCLLQDVAKRLQAHIREQDILARLGGDEFIIFLPDLVAIDQVVATCDSILLGMAEPFILHGNPYQITTSVGVSYSSMDASTLDSLIRRADIAMYAAKEQGRNKCCFFHNEMTDIANNGVKMERNLFHI